MVWVRAFGFVDLVRGMGLGPCRSVVVGGFAHRWVFFFFFLDGFGDWW